MVYRFFDKKLKGSSVKSAPQNEQLAEELHKSIVKNFEKRKVYSAFKNYTWAADLGYMQLTSKFNKGFIFLLCVLDTFKYIIYIFSKYPWVDPLKD